MAEQIVTVFGASGFLGRAVVARLSGAGMSVRAAARRPGRLRPVEGEQRIAPVEADVRDASSVAAAVEGADAVVNVVGLYVESGAETFDAVHVKGAATVADRARRAGARSLVHISGIGASLDSASAYVRARARGEIVVREEFDRAAILRPSVLFGPGDAFLNTIDAVTRLAPVFPLFGRGDTRLQPIYMEDVAEAVLRSIGNPAVSGRIGELGGPEVYTYRRVVEAVLAFRGRRRLLLPVPFALWSLQAKALSVLPNPPLSQDQVVLMRDHNVVGQGMVTLRDLGVEGHRLEALLPRCLASIIP